ncbi:hypothetical protein NHX12_023037 [Muraenolepis orangiensis]|uniref:Kinesin motor domain-containing protein n=1 Tax=Muraenolepis orangiensis TaxID=630683 RepID=A0A9Q0IRV8_9TELE|nr:hypothetical protein NHX12_023037 [Muraenolepis orangiensis]
MESCFNNKLEVMIPVVLDDLKKDLCIQFSALPDTQQDGVVVVKEHLDVYLRIRPFTTAERHSGEAQDCVTLESPETVLLKPPGTSLRLSEKSVPPTGQRFHFSKAYGPETSQNNLFEGTVKDRVRHVLEGGNSLVFTYGVTNAGKTFTFLGLDGDAGLLPRSLQLVFSSVGDHVSPHMGVKPQRCREFSRLTQEQQTEEALAKRNLLRQLKESEKASASQLCSTSKNSLEGPSVLGSLLEDSVCLDVDPETKFSIWVSFCEIYNENIHDLLEPGPSGAPRRAALRLSQDIKGNSFVKDLRWVQVNSAEEALKVMKLGRRNQSFSFTKLNHSSSRSHSIFSIRILRLDQSRVQCISELSLCDLAGSERCAKTQNRGERLKEAGNINTSLLTLGKCINALRHNQQAKLAQHIPFRESKLTHYLQSFFCGRGRACMIVNINQCASMYDETLNVLKFSSVAQKVVVLTSKILPIRPQRSAREVSFLINNADRKALDHRRSSLMDWDHSLEDVQTYQRQVALLKELQAHMEKEQEHNTLLEERVREEVSSEFTKLFSQMEADYKDRLERERDIWEERAESRLKIFKNLVTNLTGSGQEEQDQPVELDVIIDSMSEDLVGIKQAARATLSCLGKQSPDGLRMKVLSLDQQLKESQELLAAKTTELEHSTNELEHSTKYLDQTRQTLESLELKMTEICKEKDDLISRLQKTVDQQLQEASDSMSSLNSIREEGQRLRSSRPPGEKMGLGSGPPTEHVNPGSRKRQGGSQQAPDGLPPSKKESCGGADGDPEQQERSPVKLAVEEQARAAALKALEEQHQKVLAELQAERRAREEELVALEEQTIGKEEAVASLKEEKRGREEVVASLKEERRGREEAAASLKEERSGREEAVASLEEERRGREDAVASLEEERRGREEAVASLEEERRGREEAVASLEEERRGREEAVASLEEERRGREEAVASLEEERRAGEKDQATKEERAEQMPKQLPVDGAQQEKHEEQLHQKDLHVHRLEQEVREASLAKERLVESQREQQGKRRELLAVAEEAIREKDAELERRGLELHRLKEQSVLDSDRVKSLGVDLQRGDDDTADLREKLADSKRQIQQVHKEVSLRHEEEKALKQKLTDAEKSRKQLQTELSSRDRTIQLLRKDQSQPNTQLYQKACQDLECQQGVMEEMQLDHLKGLTETHGNTKYTPTPRFSQSEELQQARKEAIKAQESLKLCTEKQQADRMRWLEEKRLLIGQAKEAEERRNQEMRKFVEDRERYAREHIQLESVCAELGVKDQTMEDWRRERDSLVSALEVQLQKLLSSNTDKERLIEKLRSEACPPSEVGVQQLHSDASPPPEVGVQQLRSDASPPPETKGEGSPATEGGKPLVSTSRSSAERTSLGSTEFPSVLESSHISTENGRKSRFPQPEMEISFSPLQPNRMALRRQGEQDSVTVKITRSSRKRRSTEMERSFVFRRSKRKVPQQGPTPGQSSVRSRKEGALQKIGIILEEKESDHLIMKRRLRARTAK